MDSKLLKFGYTRAYKETQIEYVFSCLKRNYFHSYKIIMLFVFVIPILFPFMKNGICKAAFDLFMCLCKILD